MRKIEQLIPTSLAAARALVESSRDRTEKTLGGNTRVRLNYFAGRCTAGYEVVLYATPVVTFYADGTIGLRTGGHVTVTTRSRMNAALRGTGLLVSIERGSMTVRAAGSKPFASFTGELLLVQGERGAWFAYTSRAAYEAEREVLAEAERAGRILSGEVLDRLVADRLRAERRIA